MSSDEPTRVSSRIAGFYKKTVSQRLELLRATDLLSPDSVSALQAGGGLDVAAADTMTENVVSTFGLPLSVALNFRINQRDYIVPMAVEEPSVVAAASNAARLVRIGGGFRAEWTAPIMTAQIQLDAVPDIDAATAAVAAHRDELLALGDRAIPRMVARGGGCRDVEMRVLDESEGVAVVQLYVDVGDAMGANMVDTVAEAVAPRIAELTGGDMGLRILTNLPLRRTVTVRATLDASALGGDQLADGIARASRFASLDPLRAATHNKGIMNGIDAAAIATGQDWRAIEAGAHAFAALEGQYRPLATWTRTADGIEGAMTLPLAVGIVGGSTRVHPGVRAALELLAVDEAGELGGVLAAVGLASNLAALRALAGEGIQRGHMKLHNRRLAAQASAADETAEGNR